MFDASKTCPLIGGECLEHKCQWFVRLLGANPQTGQQIDEFGCAVAWLPVLLIEGTQQTRQTGAAIESFRNEVVKQHQAMLKEASAHRPDRIAPSPPIIEVGNTLRGLKEESDD